MFDMNQLGEMEQDFWDLCDEYLGERLTDDFVDWLKLTDFFVAPASASHHLACEGGLLAHSLNVCKRLLNQERELPGIGKDTLVLVSLFHDLCKAQTYKPDYWNRRQPDGSWQRELHYKFDVFLPMGHGEKSVYLLMRYGIQLTNEEALAIRWHMGGWDNAVKGGSRDLSTAQRITRLVTALHCADIQATFFDEEGM